MKNKWKYISKIIIIMIVNIYKIIFHFCIDIYTNFVILLIESTYITCSLPLLLAKFKNS